MWVLLDSAGSYVLFDFIIVIILLFLATRLTIVVNIILTACSIHCRLTKQLLLLSSQFPTSRSSFSSYYYFFYFTFSFPPIFLVLSAVNAYANFEIYGLWSVISNGKWKRLIFIFTFHPSTGHVASSVVFLFIFSLTRCKLQIIIFLYNSSLTKKKIVQYYICSNYTICTVY